MDSMRKVIVFREFHNNVMKDKIIMEEENMRFESVNQYIKVGKLQSGKYINLPYS